MFYVIGLGLSDEKDITVKGLEVRSTALGMYGSS
jgi:diphthamide biosynthesis methyltransferase